MIFLEKIFNKLQSLINSIKNKVSEFNTIFLSLLKYKSYIIFIKLKAIIKNILQLKFLEIKRNSSKKNFRLKNLKFLASWSHSKEKKDHSKSILIDCMWDNANYWLRYSFFRKAMKLSQYNEYAIFSDSTISSEKLITETFKFISLGSSNLSSKPNLKNIKKAYLLLKNVKNNSDFLKIKLPFKFPISILYDDILKKQLRASIDLKDKKIIYYLAELLTFLEETENLFERKNFNLVVLSHGMGFTFTSLAWIALNKKIPVYILYGDFSTKRFFFLENPSDLFSYPSRVTNEEIKLLPNKYKLFLISKGYDLIKERFSGISKDIGAKYAYNRISKNIDKNLICKNYEWDIKKPIIMIYTSVWFDFPHGSGLKHFDDFFDWIKQTLKVVSNNTNVNWLIKPHPLEEFFPYIKGNNLKNLVNSQNKKHIKLTQKNWASTQVLNSVDGIITCHGTIGLEASILGIPVLVPYKGYYGHLSFVNLSLSKKDYFKKLNTDWYLKKPSKTSKDKAALFSALYYGRPKWQKYLYSPDENQDKIYLDINEMFLNNSQTIKSEIVNLKNWIKSKHKYYQIFKMLNDYKNK
tara:strand:- start:839 stop:2575 length:1737 start_codon:yes stop_codon:yes gene_type:complete